MINKERVIELLGLLNKELDNLEEEEEIHMAVTTPQFSMIELKRESKFQEIWCLDKSELATVKELETKAKNSNNTTIVNKFNRFLKIK